MERNTCKAHKGGAAFICNITRTCPFSGESSGYNKVTIVKPIHAEKPKSAIAVDKGKPRGMHAKKHSTETEANTN